MISAQTALFYTDTNDMTVSKEVNDWLDDRIKARCAQGKHHLTLIPKDMRVLQDEWGITPNAMVQYARKAGYKVSYDNAEDTYILRWGE